MLTFKRAGNVVVVSDDGREIATVRPLEREKLIVSSLSVIAIAGVFVATRNAGSTPWFEGVVSIGALAQLAWGAWGTTTIEVSHGFICIRRRLLGVNVLSQKFRTGTSAERRESVRSVKGQEVVRQRVFVGPESQRMALPVAVDRDGGDALAEMINARASARADQDL